MVSRIAILKARGPPTCGGSADSMRPAAALQRMPLAAVGVVALAGAAQAQESFDDRLSGDWSGVRSRLADHGVTFDLESASYYQGLLSGFGDDDFQYAGRFDGRSI